MMFAIRWYAMRATSGTITCGSRVRNRKSVRPGIEALERRALMASLAFASGSQLSATLHMDLPPILSSLAFDQKKLDDTATVTDLNGGGSAEAGTTFVPASSNINAFSTANYTVAASGNGSNWRLTFDESGSAMWNQSDTPIHDVAGTGDSPVTVTVQPGPNDHMGDPVTVVLTADLSITIPHGVTVPVTSPYQPLPGGNGFFSHETDITTTHEVTYVSGDQPGDQPPLLDTTFSSQGQYGTFPTHQQVPIETKVGQSLKISISNDTTGTLTYAGPCCLDGFNFEQKLTVALALESSPPDLRVHVDAAHVVPSQATDLNLYQFFGGETINVPVTVTNKGTGAANGTVQVDLYLSKTQEIPDSDPIDTMKQPVQDLTSTSEPVNFDFKNVKIPDLPEDTESEFADYYLVAEVSSPDIPQTDDAAQNDSNASAEPFDYLGVPTYTTVFTGPDEVYFDFIRDTLNASNGEAQWAVQKQDGRVKDLSDGMAFVKAFETDIRYPYLDPKGIPTIGVGINLTEIETPFPKMSPDYFVLQQHLAADVIAYYSAMSELPSYRVIYNRIRNDTGVYSYKVVQLLENQALQEVKKIALFVGDDDSLFAEAYGLRQKAAQQILGSTWDNLSARERITPIDQLYNSKGGIFSQMKNDLANNEFILAGFDVVDSKNVSDSLTNPKLKGLGLRMEAEFQNLVAGHVDDLGEIVAS